MKENRKLFFTILATACCTTASWATDFSGAILTGYKGGLGITVSGTASDFAAGFPLSFEMTLGYTSLDPGNAEQARGIFINDATNGTPQKKGYMWEMHLDFLHRVKVFGIRDTYLYAGIRRSMFTANFRYVGGNEDFDVTSNQWGIGAGLKVSFPMGNRVSFVLMTGIDNYFASTLYGHDTSYSPAGEVLNGKHSFTYKEADAVINHPKLQFTGLLGISYGF